jgi:hypothetical protein
MLHVVLAPIKLFLSYKTAVSTLLVMAASKDIHTPKIEIQELDKSVFTLLPYYSRDSMRDIMG